MTAHNVLEQALNDGLAIVLTDAGKLRLTGQASVIRRWKQPITDNRDEIVNIIKGRSRRGYKRDRFPFAAEKLDDLQAHFGNGVRVVYARQDTDEIGERLREHEIGVPASENVSEVMPTEGCECSACRRRRKPTKTDVRKRQTQPGAEFGLNAHKRFQQETTYRADLAEERWQEGMQLLLRGRHGPAGPGDDEDDD